MPVSQSLYPLPKLPLHNFPIPILVLYNLLQRCGTLPSHYFILRHTFPINRPKQQNPLSHIPTPIRIKPITHNPLLPCPTPQKSPKYHSFPSPPTPSPQTPNSFPQRPPAPPQPALPLPPLTTLQSSHTPPTPSP
ncbi:hypothetical protein K432DRAFT_154273 [Lepidopterella palustris CBS 459.81]|uniref:Uncharacterized protein n=1 Tax=Lepidopterella palustris CBS 459.81 TaxID=1314670 RepID=A0A8E2E2B9_9PEZI|nr:hypothetical protein K432DRAFT_154273 [Lepidopterella palustris CBS 459.81]